jgi:tRNA-dihydrouridine synthase
MGCPKKFSVHGGMGSALMRDVENAQRIMKSLV